MKHRLLLKLYEVSKDNFIHSWTQAILTALVLPLLRFAYLRANPEARDLILRHSLLEANGFNLFMSDVDVTIIADSPPAVKKLLRSYFRMKRLFPLLGEPEVHARSLWDEVSALASPANELVWSKVFQLRKLGWQRRRLETEENPYHRAKLLRGLGATRKKLRTTEDAVDLEAIVPGCPGSEIAFASPSYLEYLGCWVGRPGEREHIVQTSNLRLASGFCQLLPGQDCPDPELRSHPLRGFLTLKEILVAQASLDLHSYLRSDFDPRDLQSWIDRLRTSISGEPPAPTV